MAEGDDRRDREQEKRGPTRTLWSVLTYGFRRPLRDLGDNASAVRLQWGRFREARAKRLRAAQAQHQNYERRVQGLTPRERFESEAQRGGWTPEQLQGQLRAVRIAKRLCMVVCVLGFLTTLVMVFRAPPLLAFILAAVAVAVLGAFLALAVRNAWWEFELQGRVLIPLADFLARPDLFRRLFS